MSLRAQDAATLLPAEASPLVAVLDTAFQVGHPALRPRLVTGYNAMTGTADVGLKLTDLELYTHGTAVASIVSSDAQLGAWPRGVYPAARILPIKVCCTPESGGTMTNGNLLRQGILYAAGIANDYGQASPERARVINISYVLSPEYDIGLLDAIEQATQAGSVVVTSLGEGAPNISPYLAGIPGVIGVRTAPNGAHRPATGFPIPVIPAPGSGILALLPGGTLLGGLIPSLGTVSGSSFAAATASAVAAMVLAANPNLSAGDVAGILSSSSVYDAEGLDAVLAVQMADELPLPPPAGGGGGGGSGSDGGGGAMNLLALLVLALVACRKMPTLRSRENPACAALSARSRTATSYRS